MDRQESRMVPTIASGYRIIGRPGAVLSALMLLATVIDEWYVLGGPLAIFRGQ